MKGKILVAAIGVTLSASAIAASAQNGSDTETAIAAMEDVQLTLSEIRNLEDLGKIQIISIEAVGSTEAEALQSQVDNRKADVEDLQAAIGANEKLMDRLTSEDPDFSLDSVVAADMREDGTLFIYSLGQGASN